MPKTPLSELSSAPALPAARRLAAARPFAAERYGAAGSNGRGRRWIDVTRDDLLAARLRLLEGFISRTEITDCAQYALQWAGEVLGVSRSICLVRAAGEQLLITAGAFGFAAAKGAPFTVSLEDWSNPLIVALTTRSETAFPAVQVPVDRRRRPATPFQGAAFHAIPLGATGFSDDAFGLLLLSGDAQPSRPELAWFTQHFGQKIDQILRQQALTEGDRRQGRERSLLYSIINAVTDPILLTDTEGRLLIANARALSLFSAAEEESEGRRGAVRMNNMLLSSALSSKAIEEAGAARRELLLVNPVDGSDLLFELLSTVTEDSRHGTGVVSILRNVTDLRRASEEIEANYRRLRAAEAQARAESDRLNLIIDSVADPIVVTDAAGATSLMNEPAERLFTMPIHSSALEQRWVQANDAHFSSFIAGMLVSADQRRVGEIGLMDPRTGDAMPVEAIAGKILSEHGELNAVVTILHDRREALEKARLYEQLKEASDELERKVQAATADIAQQNELLRRQAIELEQASALKTQFLANMSHEFRTPLNAILGYTSMLQQGVAGRIEPGVKRQLSRIESNGRHLLTIINEILDISRIEAGRMPLQLSRFRLPELVNEVKAELEPIIIRSKVGVIVDLGRGLRPITTDRQKVKQIVLNLLSNALKFTHHGTVSLIVGHDAAEKTVTIAVKDTGIGIAAADQDKIFEDFRQLDNSPTRAYGGTGLGLSICRRLAQMLNGRISLQSELGKGSVFTLTLPLRGRK
ncbi:MAG TPA: ATP-binding protein [Vicinamibacterales bacterium]|nr:ATP-binding protein [Vicinamibacterales bacterium]